MLNDQNAEFEIIGIMQGFCRMAVQNDLNGISPMKLCPREILSQASVQSFGIDALRLIGQLAHHSQGCRHGLLYGFYGKKIEMSGRNSRNRFETTVCSAPETACVLQLHPASLPANAEKENINREKNRMTDVFIPWKMTLRIYDKLNSITNNRRRYFSSPPFDSGRRWQEISSFGLFARIGEKNRPDNRIFLYKKRPQRSRPNNFLVSKILLSSSPEILILILVEEIYLY